MSLPRIEAVLNRMSIFSGATLDDAASELEEIASDAKLPRIVDKVAIGDAVAVIPQVLSNSAAVKSVCLFLANACVTDDLRNVGYLLQNNGVSVLKQVLVEKDESPALVFAVLDVLSTCCTSSGAARDAFGVTVPDILNCIRKNKSNLEVLFGACCALSTLTMAHPSNALLVAENNGLQVFVEVFKYAHKQLRIIRNQEQATQLNDIARWSKHALLNCCRAGTSSIDPFVENLQFGTFGEMIVVDELRLAIQLERKKSKPSGSSRPHVQ